MEEKKKNLLIIQDKNDFYKNLMRDAANRLCSMLKDSNYTEILVKGKDFDDTELLSNAKNDGFENIFLDLDIDQETLFHLLRSALRYGFTSYNVKTGEIIDDLIISHKKGIYREYKLMETRSNQALGVLFDNESPKLEKLYKQVCKYNGLEYTETMHVNTTDPEAWTHFLTEVLKKDYGTILVSSPDNVTLSESDNPLIELLNEYEIELVDAVASLSLSDLQTYLSNQNQNCKIKAITATSGMGINFQKSMFNYGMNNGYELICGCCIDELAGFQGTVNTLLQFAKEQNASTIIIPSKSHFPFSEREWTEMIEILEDHNIKIESVKEGDLTMKKTPNLQLMN